jgi:hypothetical protein
MPFDMAMGSELSRRQFHAIAQGLLAENESLRRQLVEREQLYQNAMAGRIRVTDTLEQVATQRDQLFGETEQLKAEVEALRKLAVELRGAAKCYNLHHCKAEQHGISEPCKVLARIDSAMGKERK